MKGIWILLAILLGFLVFNYLGPRMIVQVDHLVFRWLRPSKTTAPMPSTLNGARVQIKTHDGLIQKGVWLKADGGLPKGTLILLHGIRANKEHFWPVAKRLTSDGFHVLLIDMRAHGQSEGKYCTFGFYEKQDVRLWIDYLESLEQPTGPIGIWGQSLGGAVGLQAMALDQRLQFGIIESTFSDLKTIIHDYNRFFLGFDIPWLTTYLIWRAEGVATFYSQMVRPSESAKLIKQPVFIVHGTDDQRINISYGKQNFDNISSVQKEFYAVDGANHLNVWEKGGDAYFNRAFDFIHKAIGELNP